MALWPPSPALTVNYVSSVLIKSALWAPSSGSTLATGANSAEMWTMCRASGSLTLLLTVAVGAPGIGCMPVKTLTTVSMLWHVTLDKQPEGGNLNCEQHMATDSKADGFPYSPVDSEPEEMKSKIETNLTCPRLLPSWPFPSSTFFGGGPIDASLHLLDVEFCRICLPK